MRVWKNWEVTLTVNRYRYSFWDGNILELVIIVVQHSKSIKSRWLKHFKLVDFILCEVYLNKNTTKFTVTNSCSNTIKGMMYLLCVYLTHPRYVFLFFAHASPWICLPVHIVAKGKERLIWHSFKFTVLFYCSSSLFSPPIMGKNRY